MTSPLDEYRSRLRESLTIINDLKAKVASAERAKTEPIAIVGMACRFPGGSTSIDAFWDNLVRGIDGVVEVPAERWSTTEIEAAGSEVRWAALIDSIDQFDAAFFGISPRESASLDPQHRLLLEVTWEAIEDAGVRPEQLDGSRTGVYMGICTNDYWHGIVRQGTGSVDAYGATGNLFSTAAGRISYWLGARGPCASIDTACSSSLVALDFACQGLRNGGCDVAIVGGVNAILSPFSMTMMSRLGALSPDGRCKTFDARANGYVRGEGCGVIVIKRLSDARRDGDHIRAVILGSAVNQDGRSTGLTTPNVLSQQALLQQALENARVSAEDIGYVETHGTGTPLGDPIEVDALKAIMGQPRRNGLPCALGALKTNIGHLEGAAGIAGVIKAVLCLEREAIPKNLHYRALNPRIDLEGTPFFIPRDMTPWGRADKPRRAGISSFGISGTNAHVILEEAPRQEQPDPEKEASAYLLPLSAKSQDALTGFARSYANWFSITNDHSLYDIVYTASMRRAHHEHRLAVVAGKREDFAHAFAAIAKGDVPGGVARGHVSPHDPPRIVFVFPGQGSQWVGMGRQLLAEEPVFRRAIEVCDTAIKNESGFSILEQIAADQAFARIGEIDVVQPLLFAIEVALAALWRSWGVEPDCVVGHSMGEVAACHVAGILPLEDAVRVICRRSRLLKRIRGQGAMALVELPMLEAEAAIAGYESSLGIAVSNGPRSTVLSGDPDAVEHVLAALESKGVFCRRVKVDVASHSPQVDPLRPELLAALRDVKPVASKLPMRSTVTGQLVQGPELSAPYWADNLRQPVRFSAVVRDLIGDGHHLFIELSPHPILLPSIVENLDDLGVKGASIASMRRQTNERQTMLEGLGLLYVRGCSIDWSKVHFGQGRVASIPAYSWQRERFWIDAPKSRAHVAQNDRGHPLLGIGYTPASQPQLHVWEQHVSLEALPYLADHCVRGEVVFPGAGYVEMAIAAANQVYGDGVARIEELTFEGMLVIPQNTERILQLSLVEESGGRGFVTISSKQDGEKDWVRHCSGTVRVVAASTQAPETVDRNGARARCPHVITGSNHYDQMAIRGLSYGKSFQGVAEVRRGTNEIIAHVQLTSDIVDEAHAYVVHPALLDACFQAASWAMHIPDENATLVPVKVGGVRLHERPEREVWIHARVRADAENGSPAISIVARNDQEHVLFEVADFRIQALDSVRASSDDPFEDCIFEVSWRRLELPNAPRIADRQCVSWLVLVDQRGLGSVLAERLRTQGDRVVEVTASSEYSSRGDDAYTIDPADVAQWDQVLSKAFGKLGCHGVIHCGSLDGATWSQTTADTISADVRRSTLSVLRMVQALLKQGWRDVPRLYVLTRAAQPVGAAAMPLSVSQSMVWGLGRVIAMEQPDLGCVRIDLPPEAHPEEPSFILRELNSGADEDQVAMRHDARYVARLVRGSWKSGAITRERLEPAAGRPYRLEIDKPGVLEHLALRPIERRPPGPGEVEIEVEAAGLNFLDVLLAMGILPDDVAELDARGPRLGSECAGRVVAVGEDVVGLQVGDEVIALAPSAMATHVIAKRPLVIQKPDTLSWSQAGTLPIVFLTAYYALAHVARLEKGERILIHAGAGGVGMAAIQWARHVGAVIFATAGSEEKRALLRELGVHHVMDSRSMSFAEEIRRMTGGEGVDVVLNSLSGAFLDASFALLRDHGRFIEIGKRDYYDNRPLGSRPFLKNLSFSLVDLRGMIQKRPHTVATLLQELVKRFNEGILEPITHRSFPLSKAVEAFGLMAQGKHVGKLALQVRESDATITTMAENVGRIRAERTYLLTGGLGGLGLSLAKWMVDQGGRHLALVGRSDPSPMATAAIAEMRAAGANVHTLRADVAKRADVDAVFAHIDNVMPPLGGIVHAAGALADRTLPDMEEAAFYKAVDPKVFGAWNLHEASRHMPLDFFVMFSSAAGLLGSPGQGNYVAANAFLDAICHARVASGLAGTSIQWGAFADVGLAAAADNRANRIATRGSATFKPEEGNLLFGRVLGQPRPGVGLMHFNVRQWIEYYPHVAGAPFFAELVHKGANPTVSSPKKGFLDELEQADQTVRLEMLEAHVIEQLSKVLRLSPERIDKRTPFTNLGMDSLMSLELRNRLEASLVIKLSAALLFTYTTVERLSDFLLGKLKLEKDSTEQSLSVARHEATEPMAHLSTPAADSQEADDDLLALFDASAARVRRENLR